MTFICEELLRNASRSRQLGRAKQQRSAGVRRLQSALIVTFMLFLPMVASHAKSANSGKALPPQIIAYIFPRDRKLQPAEIAAAKLTRINYAFANIKDGRMVTGFASDSENFAFLTGLRKQNPGFTVLVSVGGWLWSTNFSDISLTWSTIKICLF